MEWELQLLGVGKRYEGVLAVDDLTIDVAPGELLTLLGPSGSGKTTGLLMIAGFVEPTRGQILLRGRDITKVPPYKRNIGMVFQNYALFPHMTVGENVAFPLKMRRMASRDIEQRVERVLRLVELEGMNRRYPAQLSGGQQQRVALARAVIFEPLLMLMDEPLGALDRQLREQMQLEIKHLQRKLGITVIYVTHDQSEALTISDRIAVMNRGRLEQLGPPGELYDRPRNRFVATFLGESNLFDGTVITIQQDGAGVRTDRGLILKVPASPGLSVGRRLTVSVRPEKLIIGSQLTDNGHPGCIKELIYLGDMIKLRVELVGGEMVLVKEKNGETKVLPREEDAVQVGWETSDAVVFLDR